MLPIRPMDKVIPLNHIIVEEKIIIDNLNKLDNHLVDNSYFEEDLN